VAWNVILVDEVDDWYEENIPLAEQRYQRWLDGGYSTEKTA
jgi:hypothetical protein